MCLRPRSTHMDYILFRYYPNKSRVKGFFDDDDGQIYINKTLNKHDRAIVFAHESQHRECFITKCWCWKQKTVFWCEYHAFKAEFAFVSGMDNHRYWHTYFKAVISGLTKYKEAENIGTWMDHFRALRKVCRFKAFQEAADRYGYQERVNELL